MRRRKAKKLIMLISLIYFAFSLTTFTLTLKKFISTKKENIITTTSSKSDIDLVKSKFNEYVKTTKGAKLYIKDKSKYKEEVTISGTIELRLDPEYKISDKYYKIYNSDYYIPYNQTSSIDKPTNSVGEYKTYSNYVTFNENITLKDKAKLYVDESSYFQVKKKEYTIIIKDDNRYGIEFLNRLVYVNSNDVEKVSKNNNNNKEIADAVAVLNYHYTVSSTNENGELTECKQTICITDTMFDEHVSYLEKNGYYGASIRDLELFIDGKINLPSHSVLLTIDDGWYVARSIGILEKHKFLGTLFLIGSLASPDAYRSSYLEIHSHSWNMHNINECSGGNYGGAILCKPEEYILEDLQKSRKSLNNTKYFCYPFYDYNDRAIELLKKAGFTMAFGGGEKKVKVGQDKFKIPRYVIVNNTSMNEFISFIS